MTGTFGLDLDRAKAN